LNHRLHTHVLTALMVALAAGAAAPAFGQGAHDPVQRSAAVARTVDFRSSSWLSDQVVVNNNGEDIASVSDLILDRGSGRIEYIVIKTGTTLGLGGRAVAIPYSSFRSEAGGKERLILASTAEQLKQAPEYTAESWKAMKEPTKDERSALRQKLSDAAAPGDPYAGALDTAKRIRVEGEIKKVERVRTSTFGEQVVITVGTADGSARKIALGPSWFVNATAAAPMRGDKVIVETLALPRDPDQLLAGTDLRCGDRELHLRDTDGSAAWALKSVEAGGRTYSAPYSRYLVMSQLPGMKVDCRGDELGKVNDVILDRTSGEIGFLSIDPNQNFLGIGDTKRLIPWSIATVTLDGIMRIDASKEMVLASPETPEDLATLNSSTQGERVYKAFNVPAPRFEVSKPVPMAIPRGDNAWSADGSILGAIDRDSARTLEGKVIGMSEVKFEKGVQPARALKIKITGDGAGEELVLVGPSWYMDNQKPIYATGDSIKVDARRTTIDGRTYWIAKSIDCKNASVVLLDKNNNPVWAKP